MNSRPDFCPGCGAQVYPEETHCPFCGRGLRSSPWLSFLMGLGGAGAALLVGGLIWWVLDALPSFQSPAAPAAQQQAAVEPAAPAPPGAAAPAFPAPTAAPAQSPAAAPSGIFGAPPGLAPSPPPAAGAPGLPTGAAGASAFAEAPSAATKDTERFSSAAPGGAKVAPADPQTASVSEQQLPLPTVHAPAPEVAADIEARRAFAKSTQERFTDNGLDLTVATSGEAERVLTIKFNFPAKTAAELIIAGPFPNQCAQRGFKQVVFVDPSGVSWLYDVATQKMTEK